MVRVLSPFRHSFSETRHIEFTVFRAFSIRERNCWKLDAFFASAASTSGPADTVRELRRRQGDEPANRRRSARASVETVRVPLDSFATALNSSRRAGNSWPPSD
jgi:hypothetical protein